MLARKRRLTNEEKLIQKNIIWLGKLKNKYFLPSDMSGYNKNVMKPVFKMSKDQFVNYDRATPLRKLIGDENGEMRMKVSNYAIKTDLNVGHNGEWEDVKKLLVKLHFQLEENNALPAMFKLEKVEKSNSCKEGYTQITLPNKKEIIEGNTEGYLVLIPKDQKNIIMPRYYNYLMDALEETNKKGTYKLIRRREKIITIIGLPEVNCYNKKNGTIWMKIKY